jgi:hypothetical protein
MFDRVAPDCLFDFIVGKRIDPGMRCGQFLVEQFDGRLRRQFGCGGAFAKTPVHFARLFVAQFFSEGQMAKSQLMRLRRAGEAAVERRRELSQKVDRIF